MDLVAARWLLHYDVRLRQRADEPPRLLLLPARTSTEEATGDETARSRRHRPVVTPSVSVEPEDETTTARLPLVRPSVSRPRTSWSPPAATVHPAPHPHDDGSISIPIFVDSAFPPAARAASEWASTDLDAIPVFVHESRAGRRPAPVGVVGAEPQESFFPPAVGLVPTPTDVDRAPIFSFTPPVITDVDQAPVFSFTPPAAITDVDQAPAFSFTPPVTSEPLRTADLCVIPDAEWTPIERDPIARAVPEAEPAARATPAPAASGYPPLPRRLLALTPPPPPVMPRFLEPPSPPPPPAPVAATPSSAAPAKAPLVLDLTPPSVPQLPPPPAPLPPPPPASLPERPAAKLTFDELPNPWAANTREPEVVTPPLEATTSTSPRRLRPILVRTAFLAVLSVIGGVGIRNATLRARAAKPAPAATAATTAAPAPPTATAPTVASEGTLDIRAPERAPVTVDGKLRGEGSLTLKLAPGYHSVRAGGERSQIVQIHRGASASVDFTR